MSVHQRKKITVSVLIPFLVFTLFFSIMIWQKYRSSQEVPDASQQNVKNYRSVTLFFAAEDTRLARETRDVWVCDDESTCLKNVIHELLNGPVGMFEATLPDGVAVNSVRIEGDLATVDFNHNFSDAMISGSSAEMLAVYSVVNTVTVNFPNIVRVKLNVDGNPGVILQHLDLSDPLTADYSLEQSVPAAPESTSSDPAPKQREGGAR